MAGWGSNAGARAGAKLALKVVWADACIFAGGERILADLVCEIGGADAVCGVLVGAALNSGQVDIGHDGALDLVRTLDSLLNRLRITYGTRLDVTKRLSGDSGGQESGGDE